MLMREGGGEGDDEEGENSGVKRKATSSDAPVPKKADFFAPKNSKK